MKYRKKPVVIEAVQYTGKTMAMADVPQWLIDAMFDRTVRPSTDENAKELKVSTLEGVRTVSVDDWIIREINGEIYPCKPDIFADTYEAAE